MATVVASVEPVQDWEAATAVVTAVVTAVPVLLQQLQWQSQLLRPFLCAALLTAAAQEALRSSGEVLAVVWEALASDYFPVPASATEEVSVLAVVSEVALATASPSLVPPSP